MASTLAWTSHGERLAILATVAAFDFGTVTDRQFTPGVQSFRGERRDDVRNTQSEHLRMRVAKQGARRFVGIHDPAIEVVHQGGIARLN